MPNILKSIGHLTHLMRVVWNGSAWDHLGAMATSGPRLEHPSAPFKAPRQTITASAPARAATAPPCSADSPLP